MKGNNRLTPVVLAGGSGTRLWPLSSPAAPKQFVIKNAQGKSLFQEAMARVATREIFFPPVVVTTTRHQPLASEQLAESGISEATLILEPTGRNTAPAIALAALHLMQRDASALMLVLPSDHRIEEPEVFLKAVHAGCQTARDGHIVTFAIRPTSPETGYGYIEYADASQQMPNIRRIAQFIEKPKRAKAEEFVASGRYGWNSGIFLMRADVALEQLHFYAPEIVNACQLAYVHGDVQAHLVVPHEASFVVSPPIPFDKAVMEHTKKGVVIEVVMGWRDVGSWAALEAEVTNKP